MRFLLVIFFFMLFMGIVLYSCKSINKIKKENKDAAERELENKRRQRLEMENTEFDYGHNRNENKEYYGG